MSALVLDTNIVLDLLLFQNPQAQGLRQALDQQHLRWLATPPMREELARVLAYPKIAPGLTRLGHSLASLLAQWDALVSVVEVAPRCAVRCRDPDDQGFIDLAAALAATAAANAAGAVLLISRDKAVLRLRRAMRRLAVTLLSPAELRTDLQAYQTLRQHSATTSP